MGRTIRIEGISVCQAPNWRWKTILHLAFSWPATRPFEGGELPVCDLQGKSRTLLTAEGKRLAREFGATFLG